NEHDAGLPETRAPDPGFAGVLHDWVGGEELEAVLADDDDMTGGDFVRNVKQSVDLLRQVAEVAPEKETANAAATAAEACVRGVVAASSVVGR
ncbi:MAG: DEAD/DEAH box helicase, partial [Acidimicrobiia bacterium]